MSENKIKWLRNLSCKLKPIINQYKDNYKIKMIHKNACTRLECRKIIIRIH